ncbi:hypothetical protein NP493_790g00018 [Ridgeia piscesae]|uniref:Uncharacterized protein n=1 Tax=Ridgeia piscesae TaxID=27915 RepID=A0AAD9KPR5_RIDPI|nr:hypothetical protein NP493_790g00018 [Ridgeia piscesae]
MRLSRCVRRDFGFVGCHNDVVPVVDAECSGRRGCAMRAIDDVFLRAAERGCHEDLKSYLEVRYSCVSASTKNNVSFGHVTADVYALLRETPADRTVTVCAGLRRERNVYLSHGHVLQFRVASNTASRFLLHFQETVSHYTNKQTCFQVEEMTQLSCHLYHDVLLDILAMVGCPHLSPPKGGWVHLSRNRQAADLGCDDSLDRWRLIPSYLKDPLMPPDSIAPMMPRGVASAPVRKENRYARKHPKSTLPRGENNDNNERNFIELKAYLLPVDAGETIDLRNQGRAGSSNSVDTYPHYLISNAEQTTIYEPRIHCSCHTLDGGAPPSVIRSCDCLE